MNKIEYGKTWWGKQWLGALNNIDFDNRLPRGRSYAKNGYVKDLNIKEGLIQAKVIGSRPSPYKVIIKVPPVKQDKLALLAEEISQNPVLIAHLLNHYLDPEFLKVSDKLDINIFPKNWDDLEMNCSCPDWAVPCKHLAAVVYMLSQAIDTDPFLVFSLCGIDLISLLKTKHLSIKNQVKPHIPSLHELSQQSKDHKLSYSREVLDKIDFSSIPQLEELLPSVLSANPVFYNAGDLRDTLQKVINYAAKSAKKVLENNAPEPRFNSLNEPIQIVLNEDNAARGFNGQDVCSIERLEQNLAELKLTQIADLNAQWLALFYIRLTALHLLSKGAVVPQVFANAQNAVFVRWIPAMLDHKVAELINSLAQGIPEKLLLTQNGNSFKNLAQCINLCSIFLNHYMQDLWLNAIPKNTDHKLLQLLFSGSGFHFDKTTEKAIPANLQTWLSRFYLNDREYILSICLEIDQGDDILLSLAVSKAQAMHKPSPMHAVLSQKKWEKERFSILQSLALLTEFLPFLNEYIQLGAKTPHTILAQD